MVWELVSLQHLLCGLCHDPPNVEEINPFPIPQLKITSTSSFRMAAPALPALLES